MLKTVDSPLASDPCCGKRRRRVRLKSWKLLSCHKEAVEVRGPVPVPLHAGAPSKPLLRVSVAWDLVCDLALRVCDIVWLFVMVRVLSGLLSSFSCP